MNDSHAVSKTTETTTPGAIKVGSLSRSKKFYKNNKKFEDLKNLPYPFHKNVKHTVAECRQL